jgi:hypothetical protein
MLSQSTLNLHSKAAFSSPSELDSEINCKGVAAVCTYGEKPGRIMEEELKDEEKRDDDDDDDEDVGGGGGATRLVP